MLSVYAGSFNVLRLLMDEYVHYLVQTRVTHPQKKIVHPPEVVVPRRVEGALEKAVVVLCASS